MGTILAANYAAGMNRYMQLFYTPNTAVLKVLWSTLMITSLAAAQINFLFWGYTLFSCSHIT